MFFLLRTVFWLTVVFSSISWSAEALGPQLGDRRVATTDSGLATVAGFGDAVVRAAEGWCVRSAQTCLADAAKLTALVESGDGEEEREPAFPVAVAALPVPNPDPRRHALAKDLTRTR